MQMFFSSALVVFQKEFPVIQGSPATSVRGTITAWPLTLAPIGSSMLIGQLLSQDRAQVCQGKAIPVKVCEWQSVHWVITEAGGPGWPLETFLLLALFADLRKLPLVVFTCTALFGFTAGVVLHPLNFFLPLSHQLIITLANFLLLRKKQKTFLQNKTKSYILIIWH